MTTKYYVLQPFELSQPFWKMSSVNILKLSAEIDAPRYVCLQIAFDHRQMMLYASTNTVYFRRNNNS